MKFILPEIIVCITGFVVLSADFLFPKLRNKIIYISLLGAFFSLLYTFGLFGAECNIFNETFTVDNLTVIFKLLTLFSLIIVLLISNDYSEIKNFYPAEYQTLVLFSVCGVMFLVSSYDLIMIFLCFEFVGITSYLLTGFLKKNIKSSEAALKYFLIGAFSSSIMLYGMVLLYGLSGTTNISSMDLSTSRILTFALILFLAGIGFKICLVPFHQWAPDAYEGAPTSITGFISVLPKIGGLAVLLRVFGSLSSAKDITFLVALLSAITMTVGNLSAIHQTNIKRLLAYSSIAQVGYILIGFVSFDELGWNGMAFYLFAYLAMNLGAFGIVILVSNKLKSDDITAYSGLAKRSLGISLIFVLFLLSLVGIPPTAGFVGKFLVFASAIKTGYLWLAVIGVINSVISLYYYFRIVHQVFFVQPLDEEKLNFPIMLNIGIGLTFLITIVFGIYPSPILEFIK